VSPAGTFSVTALVLFSAVYYFLAAVTYGAFIPAGLFTVGASSRVFHSSQLLDNARFRHNLGIQAQTLAPSRNRQTPQVGIIFGGCFGRILAELLVAAGLIDVNVAGIVGMYALMGAGEAGWVGWVGCLDGLYDRHQRPQLSLITPRPRTPQSKTKTTPSLLSGRRHAHVGLHVPHPHGDDGGAQHPPLPDDGAGDRQGGGGPVQLQVCAAGQTPGGGFCA
jgi:hypothetical protein